MGILLEYIRNIGYFLILMSLVGNVMPDNSYKKYLKMFCGLILVVLVINPFYEFLNYDGSIKDIFKGARFDSEVAHIKGMLISNEENAKAQAIREYENILKEELADALKELASYDPKDFYSDEHIEISDDSINEFIEGVKNESCFIV